MAKGCGSGRWVRFAVLPALVALLAGAGQCSYRGHVFGVSVSGGGGGGPAAAQTTIAPVSAFGSLFAGGTEFTTTVAAITIDGLASLESQLKPGQVAAVAGSAASDGSTGTATTVAVEDKLAGPVSATDPAAGTFTVLGQTVRVTGDSSVGPGIVPADVAGLTIGDLVVIDGYRTASGLIAARIDRFASGQGLRVAGRVSGLSGLAQTFVLGGTTVDWSAAVGGLPVLVKNGSYVVASGGTATGAARLRAGLVSVTTESPAGGNGDNGRVHGAITRFGSATDFDVAGQGVTTTAATLLANGTLAELALDREVEVVGQYDRSGRLTSTSVELTPVAAFRAVGPVEAVDANGKTLRLAGITVATDARTRWDDQSSLGIRALGLGALRTGDWVEVRGLGTGALKAAARVIERRTQPAVVRVELQDVPAALANPSFTLAGVSVDARSASFTDAAGQVLSRSSFFAQAAGRVVRARGTFIGSALTAETVSLRP
jgi:hypothetical protein